MKNSSSKLVDTYKGYDIYIGMRDVALFGQSKDCYAEHIKTRDTFYFTLEVWNEARGEVYNELDKRLNRYQDIEFAECMECREKLGAAQLCNSCIHNRDAINELRGIIRAFYE